MDTLRGSLGAFTESTDHGSYDSEAVHDTPPAAIGQDERRMQVRAYNLWASLLGHRNFPAIDDLDPRSLPDFGPYSVLLDFSRGIENPGIAYLGDELAEECGVAGRELGTLVDVPQRSLLTRITDHYLQILANQAPIGFEAEFVNQRGATILYRGILLPFSSDDDAIDFIFGVINWKQLADAHAADELLLEIDQVLEPRLASAPNREDALPLADWADGPGSIAADDLPEPELLPAPSFGLGAEIAGEAEDYPEDGEEEFFTLDDEYEDESEEDGAGGYGSLLKMPLDLSRAAEKPAVALADYDSLASALPGAAPEPYAEVDPDGMGLGDWLAAARAQAASALTSEDRTRGALYQAIGRAYDFSLAAASAPREFAELLADAELTAQERAPMTPVVKLVFGADYDKTRVTEYAAALNHAHRLQLPLGTLGEFLVRHDGGLKGVINAERRLRKEEAGKPVDVQQGPRPALARKLRALPAQSFDALPAEGAEFALVMVRRTEAGEIVMLGEVPEDIALVERAARRLVG